MITPGGRVEEVAGWMDAGAVAVDAPTFRHQTFYVRHGDWLGVWALVLALALNAGAAALARVTPAGRRRGAAARLYG